MIIYLMTDFLNNVNSIKCLDIKSNSEDVFDYIDNEAFFDYEEKQEINLSEKGHLFYNVEENKEKRFLCVNLSKGKGKFFLSADYKNMVLFDSITDEFLSQELDTELLDDSFLESKKINNMNRYDCVLCNGDNSLFIDNVVADIVLQYDEDFKNAILLNKQEYDLLNFAGDSPNSCFYYMFDGNRYLRFESNTIKKVSFEKANKYSLDNIVKIDSIFSNKDYDSYIAIKKPFSLKPLKQEEVNNKDSYNIKCVINKENYYVVSNKDVLYFIKVSKSKLSTITFYNMEKKNEKFNLEYYYSKEDAIKLIGYLYNLINDEKFELSFYIKNNAVEKRILEYSSLVDYTDDLNESLVSEKANVKKLEGIIDLNNKELKKLELAQKEISLLKEAKDKLSRELDELKNKYEKSKGKLVKSHNAFANMMAFDPSNFYDLKNFKVNDDIYLRLSSISSASPSWAKYDSKESNSIYHYGDNFSSGYKNDYERINNLFIDYACNDYVSVYNDVNSINVLLCGCGDLLEIKSFIKSLNESNINHINFLCLDLNLWPENFLDEIRKSLSDKYDLFFYKCNFYYEIFYNELYKCFDIIYFSRCLLYGEQYNGCSIERIIELLNKLKDRKVYLSQVVNYNNPAAIDFENSLINKINEAGFKIRIRNGFNRECSKCNIYTSGLNYYLYLIN